MNKLLITFTIFILTSGTILSDTLPIIKTDRGPGSREMSYNPQSKNKKTKVRKPANAKRAQKMQLRKEKKLKRDSEKYMEENRKRSMEIQTPEVRERMKGNVKDANSRYKDKKKTNSSRTKKARRKYR